MFLKLFLFLNCVLIISAAEKKSIILDIGTQSNFYIDNNTEYIIKYTNNNSSNPVRITIESNDVSEMHPLLIVAQDQKSLTSWQLPYIANPLKNPQIFNRVAHTLCPSSTKYARTLPTTSINTRVLKPAEYSNPIVTIKAPSESSRIYFQILAQIQENFYIKANRVYNSTVTASEPIYYFYNFNDKENNANGSGAVLVQATSPNENCMLISIQNSTCPVYDMENNIKFDSYWQTMSNKAGIVVLNRHYPNGFYIVMVVKQDNNDCKSQSAAANLLHGRTKTKFVSLYVRNTITSNEHFVIAISTISIFAGIFIICTIIGIVFLIIGIKKEEQEMNADETDNQGLTNGHESNRWRQLFRASSRSKKSSNYVWHVAIVALFYTFPVLQLVFTYQGIVYETGNEDICYYNFLCSHPLGFIYDFNHVFSNIGYVFLGALFLIITYVKELLERSKHTNMYGLPKPYGMFYALGFALVMEGIMSACYHVCPKSSNFQFDTSFMYVMTVLMIVNVYESRHSIGDSRGYAVFGILAGATTLSVISLLIGEQLYFWIIFGIIQMTLVISLTWVLDKLLFLMLFNSEQRSKITGVHICRIILWLIGNIINLLLVAYGIYFRTGFSTYLLGVLIVNGLFYMIYYISMKICYKEKILIITWFFIVITTVIWGFALYFFVSGVTSWEKSPAESRNLNQECALVKYYDSHDIWHFLSAIALFFTFLVLLTLDEGLSNVARTDIADFHGN